VKALSLRLFTLAFTADALPDSLLERIRAEDPVELAVRGGSVEVTLRDEAAALRILGAAGAVRHVTLSGSSLEDAFLHLLDERKEIS
jgi:hypothetical protein